MKEQGLLGASYVFGGPANGHSGYVRASMLSLVAGGLLILGLGGCNKGPAPVAPATEPTTTAQASPPPPAASAAAPVAAAPAAAVSAPPAAAGAPPPPPAPKPLTVPAGSHLAVRMGQTVSAKENNVGDRFSGDLAQAVVVRGVTVFRSGTPVTGTVVAAKGQGRFKGSGDLVIAVRRVGNYSVTTSSYEAATKGKGKRTAGFVGGGAGGGALIGGLAGGGKGALLGGLLGAGAGTAGAAFTGNKNVSIPAETVVSFTLSEPITVERR